ncbi:MAG: cohesin domain-containing protein [Thermoanaerobaculia bacterium]
MIPRDTLPAPMRHLLLAAFAVAVSLAAVAPLNADGHPFGLRVATVSAAPGQRVDVAIDLEPAGAVISAIAFYVEYDPSRLVFEPPTPTALTTGDPLFRSSYGSIDAGDKRLVGICVYDPDVPLASLPTGRLATLSFRVADSAEGFVPLTIARSIDATGPDSRTVDPAAARIEPGGIAVAAPAPNGLAPGRARTARPPDASLNAESESILVPVVVRSAADRRRSTLALYNGGEADARIRVAPLGDRSVARDFTLAPHGTRNFDDVAAEIFGVHEFSDGMIIESSAPIIARSSIVGDGSGSRRTATQSIPSVPWRALGNRATFAGLRTSGSTLTLLNPGRRVLALRIRILGNDGTELARQDVEISTDETRVAVDLADLGDGVVTVDVEALNDAVFYAYAAVSDGDGGLPQFVAPR